MSKFTPVIFLATATLFFGALLNVAEALSPYNFVRDLTLGERGEDVLALQQFLNTHGALIVASGPGSPGMETAYFGRGTKVALAVWQKANGILPSVGYFGPKSRLAVRALVGTSASSTTPKNPTPPDLFAGTSIEEASPGLPVRLKIPKINTDSAIEYVGLTPEGAMAVPKGPVDVAWFNLGSRPGAIGSAVIAGHFGWKGGIPAVFDDLSQLERGDKLHVLDEKGKVTTFVVRELRTYGENDDASDVFTSGDGKAHLNLVTCKGVWNKTAKSYSERLVVFTDKE